METEAAHTRSARGSIPEETVIPAIRKTLTATALVGAVLTGAAACGTGQELSEAQKIDRAVDKLGEQRSLSMELDLDTDAATLKALDAKADPGNPMPTEAAQLLADARVSLSVQSKKPLKDSGEKDLIGMAVKLSSADMDLIEYRVAGDYAYLRADAKATADFALKYGQLTEVTINLAKLAENAKVKKFDLVVRLGKGATVTAPSQATEVTMEELTQQFLGGPTTGGLEQTPAA
ncbi:hypothetical protein AB0942_09640 [Streptomyces nodosus]|uniref:hypothetical protein n=1 Tax=Streptomyces nodosus TaxID=40318 RepID=UPI003455F628